MKYLQRLVKTTCITCLGFRGIILRRSSVLVPRQPETVPASTIILCSEVSTSTRQKYVLRSRMSLNILTSSASMSTWKKYLVAYFFTFAWKMQTFDVVFTYSCSCFVDCLSEALTDPKKSLTNLIFDYVRPNRDQKLL